MAPVNRSCWRTISFVTLLTCLLLGIPPQPATAQPPSPAQFEVEAADTSAVPGGTVTLHVRVKLDEGWHIYSTTMPADSVGPRPTAIEVTQPEGARIVSIEADHPPSVKFEPAFGIQTEYFEDEVTWTVKVALPATLTGDSAEIAGQIRYQLCTEEQCLPPTTYKFSVSLPLSQAQQGNGSAEQARPVTTPTGEESTAEDTWNTGQINSLVAALGFGFLAGLILNVMPCVLPVLSLKIYGFVQQQGVSDRRRKLLALTFAAGIIVVFIALAIVVMLLNIGWGQQFQSKEFVAIMVALLVAFALGMFDVYTIQLPGTVSRLEGELAHEETYVASFCKGMLATVLATPCSGPFLGGVLTFAVSQPPYIVLAVFSSIGVGMASPYVLLAWFPGWLRFLPRPGEWMNTMKQLMAFLLLGAAVWLLWVHRHDGVFVVWTVAFALFVGFACWLYGKLAHPLASPIRRRLAPIGAAAVLAIGWLTCYPSSLEGTPADQEPQQPLIALESSDKFRELVEESIQKGTWLEYRRTLLDRLVEEGYSVIVDWTADW